MRAASSEIIHLQAILSLPKGTEHFMSDLHGEADAFVHILNNASGAVREKVDIVLRDSLPGGYSAPKKNGSKTSRRMLTLFYADSYSDAVQKSDMLAHNAPTNCDFAVQVCDDSMEPLIRNGSICYVKRTKNIIVGNIGVFKIGGKLYVRKVEKERISALNKNYPPFLLDDYEKFEGLVVDFVEY